MSTAVSVDGMSTSERAFDVIVADDEPSELDSATVEQPRLLLIEDDEIFVAMTRVILTERGFADHRTLIAGSIADATQMLQAGDVDLILADLSLPDAYGLEVVRE